MSRVPTLDDADKLANLQDADEKITHKDMRAREIESVGRAINIFICFIVAVSWVSIESDNKPRESGQ